MCSNDNNNNPEIKKRNNPGQLSLCHLAVFQKSTGDFPFFPNRFFLLQKDFTWAPPRAGSHISHRSHRRLLSFWERAARARKKGKQAAKIYKKMKRRKEEKKENNIRTAPPFPPVTAYSNEPLKDGIEEEENR